MPEVPNQPFLSQCHSALHSTVLALSVGEKREQSHTQTHKLNSSWPSASLHSLLPLSRLLSHSLTLCSLMCLKFSIWTQTHFKRILRPSKQRHLVCRALVFFLFFPSHFSSLSIPLTGHGKTEREGVCKGQWRSSSPSPPHTQKKKERKSVLLFSSSRCSDHTI